MDDHGIFGFVFGLRLSLMAPFIICFLVLETRRSLQTQLVDS